MLVRAEEPLRLALAGIPHYFSQALLEDYSEELDSELPETATPRGNNPVRKLSSAYRSSMAR